MIDVITGARGFVGSHLSSLLPNAYGVSSSAYDLRRPAHIEALFKHAGKVDTLYHLAALVGGIGANATHPARFFYDNMIMGVQLVHAAYLHGVSKFVCVGTTCSYPKFSPIPFKEFNLFDGYPEETNAPYGIAKRSLLVMLQAYQQEYGLRFAYVIPTNLYGPGDNFEDSTSHVIPALIKKCLKAKAENAPSIEVWGTGKASRDFLYVEDAAQAIKLAGKNYDRPEPLNLGSGEEVRIDTLVYLIKEITGYTGKTVWNTSNPDGQPRRCLDTKAARQALGWQAETKLRDGLEKTVKWYESLLLPATNTPLR